MDCGFGFAKAVTLEFTTETITQKNRCNEKHNSVGKADSVTEKHS